MARGDDDRALSRGAPPYERGAGAPRSSQEGRHTAAAHGAAGVHSRSHRAAESASLCNARIATTAMFDAIKAFGSNCSQDDLLCAACWENARPAAWESDPAVVSQTMERLSCATGETQIARALRQVLQEREAVDAVIFIGDHCEDHRDELGGRQRNVSVRDRSMPCVFHEYCGPRPAVTKKPNRSSSAGGNQRRCLLRIRPDAGDVKHANSYRPSPRSAQPELRAVNRRP